MSNYGEVGTVEQAIKDLAAGKMIILLDDEDRENEGDLIVASEHATPEVINFMAMHGRGLICLTLEKSDFARLGLPMMTAENKSPRETAFGVGFEAAEGITTGISAFDRARSIAVAIDEQSGPDDIIVPGHVFPLRSVEGGIMQRDGHTEGGSDLARLAGCKASAVLCEIMRDDGHMARLPDIKAFAKKHKLTITSNKALMDYRLTHDTVCQPGAKARLPMKDNAGFEIQTFYSERDQQDHVALIADKTDKSKPCLVRIHSECLTGDVLGSTRCDCGDQLKAAQAEIAQQGGILLYLRQEGRGIGLAEKIKAYALQDRGMDTLEANKHLGHQVDQRDYGVAAQMLKSLGVDSIRLMTNNPHKIQRMEELGIRVVERIPLEVQASKESYAYLRTKANRLGHFLELGEPCVE
jgi:3,4-dihydroxy 2-butanone 4-phosphate synthase / GTP cyclohydrolase II